MADLCKQFEGGKSIHTVGRVSYSVDKICLRGLHDNQVICINLLCDSVPADGMYIHLYGETRNSMSNESTEQQRHFVIDIHFWNEIEYYENAKYLESILYKINYVI